MTATDSMPAARSSYRYYVLCLLSIVLLFNYADRLALGIALESIKAEFALSDTQLGFLSGIAFAIFYSVMGIPIARWADRGNRVTVISLCTALWGIGVALCGLAASFVQLMLIRIGVAVGEAGCNPPAFSLIADYFSRLERPRATAIYASAASLCALVGYFFAGWANEHYGWRAMFFALGMPSLLLALIARFTIVEPRLAQWGAPAAATVAGQTPYALREVWAALWRNTTYRHLLVCLTVMSFFIIGIGQWWAPFFIRSFGITTSEIGLWLSVVSGAGGLLGSYAGGELALRHAAGREQRQLSAMALAIAGGGFATICIFLSSTATAAFVMVGLAILAHSTINGPLFATMQSLVEPRMRAMAFAMAFLIANLLGLGLGPLAAGALSDVFRYWAGEDSLRYALLALAPGYFWAAWHAWRASITVEKDLSLLPVEDPI
jgi:MFS family permease